MFVFCLCHSTQLPINPLTNPPFCYLHAYLPTYLPAYPLVCLSAYILPTCNLPPNLPAFLPTLTSLSGCLPDYWTTYQLASHDTYLLTPIRIKLLLAYPLAYPPSYPPTYLPAHSPTHPNAYFTSLPSSLLTGNFCFPSFLSSPFLPPFLSSLVLSFLFFSFLCFFHPFFLPSFMTSFHSPFLPTTYGPSLQYFVFDFLLSFIFCFLV